MRAMVLKKANEPLVLQDVPTPEPTQGQVLVKVHTCGVCRTDLHIVDGELPDPKLPLIPGHQVVGVIEQLGPGVKQVQMGQRVGIPWLGSSCATCSYCSQGSENLCDACQFTGYHLDGGYAEYCVVNEAYCFPLPEAFSDLQAAPLLCAGLIGYRSLRIAGNGNKIGFYGFGASAHILIQVAKYQGKKVFAFTRPGDIEGQAFAKKLDADWAGGSDQAPPELLDAAIVFAPVGALVPVALKSVRKGGTVVCAGIHMSDIPAFPYEILWGERVLRSVANLTRRDGEEFLRLASEIPIQTEVTAYPLEEANCALDDLRHGCLSGAAVLKL